MNKKEALRVIVLAVGLYLTGLAVGYICGRSHYQIYHNQSAIDNGHAEWVTEKETGKLTFRWKDCNELGR